MLRISLLNNRAACNLALTNYGAVLKDTGVIIALSVEEGEEPQMKALYRAAQSLVKLERWDEASDCVMRGPGRAPKEEGKVWEMLAEDVERGKRKVAERAERKRRERLGREALRRGVEVSGAGTVQEFTYVDSRSLEACLSSTRQTHPTTPILSHSTLLLSHSIHRCTIHLYLTRHLLHVGSRLRWTPP